VSFFRVHLLPARDRGSSIFFAPLATDRCVVLFSLFSPQKHGPLPVPPNPTRSVFVALRALLFFPRLRTLPIFFFSVVFLFLRVAWALVDGMAMGEAITFDPPHNYFIEFVCSFLFSLCVRRSIDWIEVLAFPFVTGFDRGHLSLFSPGSAVYHFPFPFSKGKLRKVAFLFFFAN